MGGKVTYLQCLGTGATALSWGGQKSGVDNALQTVIIVFDHCALLF